MEGGISMTDNNCMLMQECNPSDCQALCCYDGVYLLPGEAELIKDVVRHFPDHFRHLPDEFITYGEWRDGTKGLKTATKPFEFTIENFPKHFNKTKCVFATADHLCSLQALAMSLGVHKWTFKPFACWLFPLRVEDGRLISPPLPGQVDPDYIDDEYPGYVSYVPCGKYVPTGRPWFEVLEEEINYFEASEHLPVWANRGISIHDIIKLAKVI